MTLLIIFATFGGSLLRIEACAYLQDNDNLVISDYVLNGYLNEIWPYIDEEKFLELAPPGNILKAAFRECGQAKIGFFALIGWNNFSDCPTLLHSGIVQEAIQRER